MTRVMTNRMRKTRKSTLAIHAAVPVIKPKPRTAAMIALIRMLSHGLANALCSLDGVLFNAAKGFHPCIKCSRETLAIFGHVDSEHISTGASWLFLLASVLGLFFERFRILLA